MDYFFGNFKDVEAETFHKLEEL